MEKHKEQELKEIEKKIKSLQLDFQKRLKEKSDKIAELVSLETSFKAHKDKINAEIEELNTRLTGIRFLEGEAQAWKKYVVNYGE